MAVPSTTASKPRISAKKETTKKGKPQAKDDGGAADQKPMPTLPSKRTKSPGVRVVRGRIYDSENGSTCHQCRQKTMDFVVSCKSQVNNKPCTIKFCHKCLLNRYGEKAEEMSLLDDWKCLKCRGTCNCSFCMKKKGHQPTGILVHAAKKTGFSSVSEMLHRGPEKSLHDKNVEDTGVSPKKQATPKKDNVYVSPRKRGKENSFDGNGGSNLKPEDSTPSPDEKKPKKMKRGGLKADDDSNKADFTLSKNNSSPKSQVSNSKPESSTQNPDEKRTKKMKGGGLKVVHDINVDVDTITKNNSSPKPQSSKKTLMGKVKKSGKEPSSKQDKGTKVQNSKTVSSESRKKVEQIDGNDGATLKDVGDFSDPTKKVQHTGGSNATIQKDVGDSDFGKIDNGVAKPMTALESCKFRKPAKKMQGNYFVSDIPLPQGTEIRTVVGIELSPKDVGPALQFLEFCASFGKVLGVGKGHGESVLRELTGGGRTSRRLQLSYNLAVRFQIQLLSLVLEDMGEECPPLSPTSGKTSWFQALGKCVSESCCAIKELASDCFDKGADGYDYLDFSKKLSLLNFLCDETLGTEKLRNWIDDQHSKFVERQKEAREKIAAAREKEKNVKKKMQDEVIKAIVAKGSQLSISEHEAMSLQMKIEAEQAHAEVLAAMDTSSKKRQRCDAIRGESILCDVDGRAFWILNGYSGESAILLQEMGTLDTICGNGERWLAYDAEQKNAIEKYIFSRKQKRHRSHKASDTPLSDSNEADPLV